MAKKKVKHITESRLLEIIKDITLNALNEIDGATYARVYNASQRAKADNQNGIHIRTVNGRRYKTNDEILSHARKLEPEAKKSLLKPYIDKPFKFYGENRLGIVCDLIFTMHDMTHLNKDRAILKGDVVFNNMEISGDGIYIDFKTDKVYYKERGSKYKYILEIDNRTSSIWNQFLNQLKLSIQKRN